MIKDTFISVFDLIIFLGVFQAMFISVFFIRSGRREVPSNLYQGLLLLSLSLAMFEELLNNTGYIVRVLPISNFAEPFNFAFGPLAFLYTRSLLFPDKKKPNWPHFLLFLFWVLYMIPYFLQPDELKYNSYVEVKHPDWDYLDVVMRFPDSPFGLRHYVNQLTAVHFSAYMVAMFVLIFKCIKELNERMFRIRDQRLRLARNVGVHFLMIFVIFGIVKLNFRGDVGDYFISTYISFMVFTTSWAVVRNSAFFAQPHSFLQFPVYQVKSFV